MSPRHVLAWDLGTSGAKAGIVCSRGEVLASEFEPTPLFLQNDGGAEQRPDDWWTAFSKATRRLLSRDVVPRSSIAALGVTAQWSGTVAIDADGAPLMNAIIWMDARGADAVRRLNGGFPSVSGYQVGKAFRFIRLTGGAPAHSGKDPIGHILWLRAAHPELYARTHKFLEPKDYLTFRLTGKLSASFDSIACHWVTDNRNPEKIGYDPGLLRMTGIERDKLPDLCSASSVLGPILAQHAESLGLPKELPVVAGAADVHSAAIGAGATRNYAAHLYIGTSSWLSCHLPKKKTDLFHNMAALPSAIPGRYLLLNEQESAGACLTHLRDKLLFADDELTTSPPPAKFFEALDRVAARSPPGSRRLLFLPWLYGERTPVEDHALRGCLFNYSLHHERADVLRSILEGVAMNTRWLFGHVERFAGQRLEELRFIGGGADSSIWSQILADVLSRPICKVKAPRLANLRGAAFIAWVGLGELNFDDVEGRVPIERRFEPDPDCKSLYDSLFVEFRKLHRATRPSFHRLNRASRSKTDPGT